MAFTSAGLPNNGQTGHYQISYDTSLSAADGVNRASSLMASCEQDWNLMASWFPGVNFGFSLPITVQIATGSGGASWQDPSGFQKLFGFSPTVVINPGSGTSVNFVRYLLVAEVTEMLMASQNAGWFEQSSFFQGADEGSMGEGLSRFLGMQFQIAIGLGGVPPSGFGVVPIWLNLGRPNFVDIDPDDHQPDPTTGCTTCFLYYLHDQLGYSIQQIIGAGAPNLAGVYQKLTGQANAWNTFISLVNNHYPPVRTYNPAGDSIFPVSEIVQFWPPNQITSGYSDTTTIDLDKPAKAQVVVTLVSDNPSVVNVPPTITVPVGATFTTLTFQTVAVAGPFAPKTVNVHATYAGKTLTAAVEVVPPRIAGVLLVPDTVIAGNSSKATVTLDRPSLNGPVVVDLVCAAPGFATVPAQVTIPQNSGFANFTVTTPAIEIAFKTAHASIDATYSGNTVTTTLTVKSKVVAGILNSLSIMPAIVNAGGFSNGTVTLVEAVPVPTVVSLAALEALVGPNGPIPGPPNQSSVATVPPSITIPAGHTSGTFSIATNHNVSPHTTRHIQIMAVAVAFKYAGLTVDG
jgi:hypothetical protein